MKEKIKRKKLSTYLEHVANSIAGCKRVKGTHKATGETVIAVSEDAIAGMVTALACIAGALDDEQENFDSYPDFVTSMLMTHAMSTCEPRMLERFKVDFDSGQIFEGDASE